MKDLVGDSERVLSRFSLVVLVLDVLALPVFCGLALLVRYGSYDTFIAYDVPLPILTKLFLSIPPVAVKLVVAALIAILILKEVFIKSKTKTLAANLVAGIGGMVFVIAYLFATQLGWFRLFQMR